MRAGVSDHTSLVKHMNRRTAWFGCFISSVEIVPGICRHCARHVDTIITPILETRRQPQRGQVNCQRLNSGKTSTAQAPGPHGH